MKALHAHDCHKTADCMNQGLAPQVPPVPASRDARKHLSDPVRGLSSQSAKGKIHSYGLSPAVLFDKGNREQSGSQK